METELAHEAPSLQTKQSLIANKKFLYLWIASVFSSITLSMYLVVEEWYVVRALDLGKSLGWVMIATTVPRILFMSIGGVIADRFSRSTILFLSDIIRAILVAGMVVLLLVDGLTFWTLTLFAFLFGTLDAFFWPARDALLPSIVDKEQLTRANSLLSTSAYISMVIGPVIAGLAITWWSFTGAFTLVAVLLLLAGLIVLFINDTRSKNGDKQVSAWQEFKEGIHYVRTSVFLVTLMAVSAVVNFFFSGALMIGIPLIVDEFLQGDALDLSFMESAFAGGMLIGGVTVGVLNLRKKRGFTALLLLTIPSVLMILLGQISLLWQGVLILGIMGIFMSVINIPIISLLQEQTDPSKIGRVMALLSMASMGLTPLSFGIIATLLSLGVPLVWILTVCGSVLLLFTLSVLWKVKVLREID